jgi:hypothetical protein
MTSKQVCQLDEEGRFVGMTVADESPLERGVFHIPAGCVAAPAPNVPAGMLARFVNGAFTFEAVPEPPVAPPPATRDQQVAAIDKQRDATINAGFTFNGALYHADPLFQSQLQAFILAYSAGILAPTAQVAIRRKDNVTVQMTQSEIVTLAGMLMQFVQATYATSWAAKDALP